MELKAIIVELESNKEVFKNMLANLSEDHCLWRPESNKWCLLEIVCHLLDEEIYDFKARIKHALENPEKALLPIDPEGWVKTRNYIDKDYNKTLQAFLKERTSSIAWLKQLQNVNWNNTIQHPELGDLSAELFLRNWLAHDYLHIRQILRYKFEFLELSSEIDLSYAGNW